MTTPADAGTIQARQGQALVVPATLYHSDGVTVVDLTPLGTTVAFQMYPTAGGVPLINTSATTLNAAGGVVQYSGTTADTAMAGAFTGWFVVTIPGQNPVAYPADGITITIYPAVGALTGPQEGPCFPWTTADAVRGAVTGIDPNADLTEWIEAASQVLYALTGRQYKGLCRATIRPGHKSCSCGGLCSAHAFGWPFVGGFGPYGLGGGYFGPYGLNMLYRGQEGPQNILLCASEIDLGHEARSVESVKIDGTEIDPTTWRLDPLGKLVRELDSAGNQLVWPCCSRVASPSGSVGTFEVRYVYGVDPPTDVVLAANVLAGEFWLGSNPGTAAQCRLPKFAQTLTRQGLTSTFITDITVILSKGFTGVSLVDQVIVAHNPDHLKRRARVLNIDVMPNRRVSP